MKSKNQKRRFLLRSKSRLFAAIVVSTLVLILIVLLPIWGSGYAKGELSWSEYEVAEGDTLWEIALRTLPDGVDTRRYIFEIRQANNLDSSFIKTGQVLRIPIR